MSLTLDVLIITLILSATLALLFCRKCVGCSLEEIYSWLIGNLISFLAFSLINLFYTLKAKFPSLSYFSLVFGLPIATLFELYWNVRGTLYVIYSSIDGNHCLNNIELFMFLFYQIIIYILIILMIVFSVEFMILKWRLRTNGCGVKEFKRQLKELYSCKEGNCNKKIKKFIKKNKVIIDRAIILEEEKEIIRRRFTRCFYKTAEQINDFCSICMEEFTMEDRVSKVGCSHFFHFECFVGWLGVKPKCPLCGFFFRKPLLFSTLTKN